MPKMEEGKQSDRETGGGGDVSMCKKVEGRQTSWPLSDTQPN